MPKKAIVGANFAERVQNQKVQFTLEAAEGQTPEVINFDLSKVSPEMVTMLALHGASQKIGDSYAGAKDSGTDPIAYAREAINDTINQLYAGDWSVTRTGSGAPRVTQLVQAFSIVTGKTLEESQEFISALNDEEKAALQKKAKIAATVAQLKAEQAVKRAQELAKKAEAEAEKEAASAGASASA